VQIERAHLQVRAHRPVEDDDALADGFQKWLSRSQEISLMAEKSAQINKT
jgi:hypothetical protein